MLSYAVAVPVGVFLGLLVNYLAEILPRLREGAENVPAAADEVKAPDALRPASRVLLSPRGVISILLVIGASVYLVTREGLSFTWAILLAYCVFFVLISVIDLEHRLVLDSVMIPAFVFALIEVFLSGRQRPLNALGGFAIGQIVVMAFYLLGHVYLWLINTGRPEDKRVDEVAFGFGDVTLATFCGLVVGFPGVIPMLVLMVLAGGIIALAYLLVRGLVMHNYRAHTPLPYGPSIVVAALVMLLWGEQVARLLSAS